MFLQAAVIRVMTLVVVWAISRLTCRQDDRVVGIEGVHALVREVEAGEGDSFVAEFGEDRGRES